jgi:hypothetical protein
VKRTWREGSLAGDPEGYIEKGSEDVQLFLWGNLEEGLSTRGFHSWTKGALRMGHLSLSLSEEAPWRGPRRQGRGLLPWGLWKIC